MTQSNILLIDDEKEKLHSLGDNISRHLKNERVAVVPWDPKVADLGNNNIHQVFNSKLEVDPILVVVDYDLSNGGLEGLYSPTITHWCQKKLIPVIEFSRNYNGELPRQQNLFKFRAPVTENEIPKFVSNITKGFVQLNESINQIQKIYQKTYSEILYEIYDENCFLHELAEYSYHLFKNSEFLNEHIKYQEFDEVKVRRMTLYLLGHIIVNAIFRFPGPILSKDALCAYFSVNTSELPKLRELFGDAKYNGPFNELGEFYWRKKVDDEVEKLFEELSNCDNISTYRDVIERKVGRKFVGHGCKRCEGKNGGFFCPFNAETVCDDNECSVSASSWIPNVASICRVKRDLYNIWKPILGEV